MATYTQTASQIEAAQESARKAAKAADFFASLLTKPTAPLGLEFMLQNKDKSNGK